MVKEDMTDPICGMKGHIKAHGMYFCNVSCIKKYEKQEGMTKNLYDAKNAEIKTCCSTGNRPWYRERLYQSLILLGAIFVIHQLLMLNGIMALHGFWHAFYDYTLLIWWALLLGFIIGGIIDYLVPREYISKFFSSSRKRTIGWSVLLGFLMSACSHGILAIGIELYRKGASIPAVIAFLMASPWANLPVTVLLFSFFGLNAFLIILSAIVVAVITGLLYQLLDRKNFIEKSKHITHISSDFSARADMKKRLEGYRKDPDISRVFRGVLSGSWSLTKMVMWWILLGMVFASAANAFIAPEMFKAYMGPTLMGLLVTLAVATVIEICSEGSAPLSFEIYRQTGAIGNSFAFLMAGVATDYTEVGLIASNIGKRSALLLPLITVPQIVMLAWVFNAIL